LAALLHFAPLNRVVACWWREVVSAVSEPEEFLP